MRVVGLITEYNPFHNGHLFHLQQSKLAAGADASIAIMSGHFLQRGEPALVDKWVRTEMALAAGVDLVFELPFPFACNSAPHFASGAVQSLQAMGVVTHLCFGSEAGELDRLEQVAKTLVDKEPQIQKKTSKLLREGVNYPTARNIAMQGHVPEQSVKALATPNNILGIEYLKALMCAASPIVPLTIKRIGADYHDLAPVGTIASATGIRSRLANGEDVAELVPEACRMILADALLEGFSLNRQRLYLALQAHLLQDERRLGQLYMVDEGIERRLALAALDADNFESLAESVKSRHWTLTRVQRTLMYVLMQALAEDMSAFVQAGPLYLRLLGHNETGRALLARIRKQKKLPIIADPARANHTLRRFYREQPVLQKLAEEMLRYDVRATQLYSLLCDDFDAGYRNQDYYQKVRSV